MSKFYEAVGRLVVYVVWMRFGRQIKIGIAVAIVLAALGLGGLLAAASRNVEEG